MSDRVWCGVYDLHPAHSYDTPAGRFVCDASVQGSGLSVIPAAAVPEARCCAYHASRGTEGALVACQPSFAVPEAPACQVRWDSRRLAWVCSHMASAVPEAQDGRVAEITWTRSQTTGTTRTEAALRADFGGWFVATGHVEDWRVVAVQPLPSAAVREGEREWALIEAAERIEDDMYFEDDATWTRAAEYFAALLRGRAAPSLAAPEGTEQ